MTTINLGKIKPLHKGAYGTAVTYRPLDFTTYLGNLYVCKATSTGNLPTNTAYFDPVVGPTGASQGGFQPEGTGAVSTTVQSKLRESLSVKDFGAVGDGVADDTAAIQAAITYACLSGRALYAPAGRYRCTSTLFSTRGFTLYGDHPIAKAPGGADFGGGSWLYFDHGGKGLALDGSNGYYTDTTLRSIGTYRNQPAPAANWAPSPHDYDIYAFGCADITIDDVLLLNPTKGIGLFGDPAHGPGRLNLYHVRMQAFQIGVMIDTAYDVVRIDNLHVWPFWRDDMRAHTYCMNNLDAIYLLRCDNPLMTNVFTIFARAGLRIGQGANGGTSKIHLVNADLDRGVYGIWVDATVKGGTTGQFENITHQGELKVPGSTGLFVQGNNCQLQFGSFDSAYCHNNTVRVEGSGNKITFSAAKATAFDQSGVGFPAFEALTANTLVFATVPTLVSPGVGGMFGPTGNIVCDVWRYFTPVVSSALGTLSGYSSAGRYKVVGNTVHVQFGIDVVTNGTATGDIRFVLPFGGEATHTSIGHGRETAITGKALTVTIPGNHNFALVNNYDNSYPGADGYKLSGTIQYPISI